MLRELPHELPGRDADFVADAVAVDEVVAECAHQVVPFVVERHGLADMLDEGVGDVAFEAPVRSTCLDALADLHAVPLA